MTTAGKAPSGGYVGVGEDDEQIFVPGEVDNTNKRMGMATDVRILAVGMSTCTAGIVLGIMDEYKRSALRWRAENAHRLPRSEKNWYFYHRSKTYYAMAKAMPFGVKLGLKMAPISMGFLVMEEGIDHARGGEKDLLSTVIAGISIGGVYSILTRQKLPEAARMIKMGFYAGLTFGAVEDVCGLMLGQRLSHVDYLRKAFGFQRPAGASEPT